ncbi:MAG: hypothetical protein PHQ80_04150 [Candidatus ainarchaeum sp.]|nr:hypothetical protein [Candidatus ainarchaeum sp.]MDD5096659.1 hypothetical protein [Candidatus ainarchaeum sp.]
MAYEVVVADAICSSTGSIVPGWQFASGAALLASVALIVFFYLLSKLFQNAEGTSWAKLELYEVLVTAIILIGLAGATDLACNARASWLFPSTSVPGDYNIYQGSVFYLEEFSDKIMLITTSLYAFYSWMDPITSMTLTGKPLGIGTAIQPTSGIAATVKPGMTNAFNMLIVGYITNKAQMFLVDFFSFGFLKYYLPLGILMRCFTPTRRIGGTIIALALGFLFVYPFLIIMEGEFGLNSLNLMSDEFIPNFWQELGTFVVPSFTGLFDLSLDSLNILGHLLQSGLGAIAFGLLYLFASAASYAFLFGLFFPAFNVLILVTTTRYLSKSMGEEIDVTNLTRLI